MTLRQFLTFSALGLIGFSPGLAAGTLTLQSVLAGLSQSLTWQSSDLTYAAAQRALDSARAAAGLKISAGTDGSLNVPLNSSNGSSTSTTTSLSLNASASLTVLPWSSNYDAVRTQERALYRAGLDRQDSRNTLALNAIQQYFNARVAALDLVNARSSEVVASQQTSVAEKQFQSGQLSKDSLETTRKNQQNAQVNTLQAQQNAELTRLQLFQTLNLSPNDSELSTTPAARAVPGGTLETLIVGALTKRSDVLAAQSRVSDANDALQNAQRDRLLPSATVSASVGQNSSSGSGGSSVTGSLNLGQGTATVSAQTPVTGTNTTPTSLTVSASLSVPIVSPAADAKISSAQNSLDSARKSLENTRQSAALDVRQKYNDATLQTRKLEYSRKVVSNAQSALEIAQKRLELGALTALDVTQAELTVKQAERDLEAQTVSQLLAVYRLENAVGTLDLMKSDLLKSDLNKGATP